jgi:hypothetical protein
MHLTPALQALLDPEEERCGGWSREQLLDMDSRFAAALERAFELGLERRASAAAQVKLPASRGPRFVASPCPDGLLHSIAADTLVFVCR